MRRVMFVVAVILGLFASASASANQSRTANAQAGARKGPVAKLIELERRKNEWLRQQLGR